MNILQYMCGRVSIIHLVLYHLHQTSPRDPPFYRWKEDICRLIEERWEDICPTRSKSGNWMNSISSILSANGNSLFESGFVRMQQSGWWALKDPSLRPKLVDDGRKRKSPAFIEESNVTVTITSIPKTIASAPIEAKPPPSIITPIPSSTTTTSINPIVVEKSTAAGTALAADEIKRKLVERLLKVDSNLLKAALIKPVDKTLPSNSGQTSGLNPIMYIPPTAAAGKKASSEEGLLPKIPTKKVKPANYVRASPHENELVDLCSRIVNPDERIRRLKRKLAVRRVSHYYILCVITLYMYNFCRIGGCLGYHFLILTI